MIFSCGERMTSEKKDVFTVLTDTLGQGLKAFRLILIFIFLFLLPSIASIVFGVVSLFQVELTRYVFLFFGLGLLAALAFCAVGGFFLYEYFLIDTIRIVYAYLTPLFRLLCRKTAGRIAEGNTGILKKGYDWSENIADCFQEAYNRKVPRLIRAGVRFILSQIPFADIMYHVSIDTNTRDTEALGNSIYTQLDTYITKRFFEENTLKWLLWFLPVGCGLEVLFLYLVRR
jgi:hypothetical protein